jgi:hypothetical protein
MYDRSREDMERGRSAWLVEGPDAVHDARNILLLHPYGCLRAREGHAL